jgi:hypothetical protein
VIQVAQLESQDKQWERTFEYHQFSPISMTEERRNKLNAIGFLWNVNFSNWMEMFEELRSVLQNGNLTTFDVAATNGYLRSWILYQRHQVKAFLA